MTLLTPADLSSDTSVRYRSVEADGVNVFYREAGPADAPTLLLLHGFPSSSHMFRNLIAALKDRYHLIAPDLPGFGFTQVPPERNYVYSFDALARTAEAFVDAVGLKRYGLYVFDYGAPVGLRLARARPQQVSSLITQNGNAYLEGLGDAWDPFRKYWAEPTLAHREALREALSLEVTRDLYLLGAPDPQLVAPESYSVDAWLLQRPEIQEIQLDLFLDYANNLTRYPEFQAYFREYQPPTLVIWGRHDPFFIPPGAEAYRRDNPNATVELLDTGHFALETHAAHIARRIHEVIGPAIG